MGMKTARLSKYDMWCALNSIVSCKHNLHFSNLRNAGAWTEDEAYQIYREKLVTLRDLYIDQLSHLETCPPGKEERISTTRW